MVKDMKLVTGKLRYHLLPDSVIRDVVKVLQHGADKYGEGNWKFATDRNAYYNALRRHVEAWREGEHLDPESGLPHLAHAICNLVIMYYMKDKTNVSNTRRKTRKHKRA